MKNFVNIFYYLIKSQFTNKSSTIVPILFSIVLVILFTFNLASFDPNIQNKLFSLLTLVICYFGLQILYSQSFDIEVKDGLFYQLQTSNVNSSSWFFAKLAQTLVQSFVILIVTILLAAFFYASSSKLLFHPLVIITNALAVFALAAMGVLLNALLLQSSSSYMLFSLFYFPITCPVLLIASSVLNEVANNKSFIDIWPWIALLLGVSVIYTTLAHLFFGVLVDDDY